LTFLHKLAARHISESGVVAKALEALAAGKEAAISRAYVPDDKMRLVAHLLCAIGQDSEEDRASMVARTCTIAVDTAKDKDEELATLLVEAIEALSGEDIVAPAACNVSALRAEFKGSEVEIKERGGNTFYTFCNRPAYPAELSIGDQKLRLCNASYRKGTYQLVKS
jgi:hypothetical protein